MIMCAYFYEVMGGLCLFGLHIVLDTSPSPLHINIRGIYLYILFTISIRKCRLHIMLNTLPSPLHIFIGGGTNLYILFSSK